MLKRLLLIASLLAFPFAATADDATPADAPAPTPVATDPTTSTVNASQLGPQTNPNSAGGSNADSSALQPAGTLPVATDPSGTGQGASSSALQAPASASDTLKVMAGEGDGTPVDPGDQPDNLWTWALFSLIIGLIVVGVMVVLRDRRRFVRTAPETVFTEELDPVPAEEPLEVDDETAETATESDAKPETEMPPPSAPAKSGKSRKRKKRKY